MKTKTELVKITEELASKSAVVKSIKSIIFNEEKNRIEIECIIPTVRQLDAVFQQVISVVKDYPLEQSELYFTCAH